MDPRLGDVVFAAFVFFAMFLLFIVAGVAGAQYPADSATMPILVAVWTSGSFWLVGVVLPIGQKIGQAWTPTISDRQRIDNFEIGGLAANGVAAAAATFAGLAALHLTQG